MAAQVKTNDGVGMGTRVTRRLNPTYAEKSLYPLGNQAEAQTMPTRGCTEIFFSGAQGRHGDVPRASSGDSYSARRTEGGGY
jgi:hypothetical protein